MGISTSEQLEDDLDVENSNTVRVQTNKTAPKTKVSTKEPPISINNQPTKKQSKNKDIIPPRSSTLSIDNRTPSSHAEIIPPNFVSVSNVLQNNKDLTFVQYVKEIRSMSKPKHSNDEIFYMLVNRYCKHILNMDKIMPIDIIEIICKYFKYSTAHFHDIIIDEQLKIYQTFSDKQKAQINFCKPFVVNIMSLNVGKNHNIYSIKHSEHIHADCKHITIKINQDIKSEHKHLILSFSHDFPSKTHVSIQFQTIQNFNSNGSIIINANKMNIVTEYRSKTLIQYIPSTNIFIKCDRLDSLRVLRPKIAAGKTSYSDFTGDLIIEAKYIRNDDLHWGPLLYFGSIFIECDSISGLNRLRLNALNSNIIIKSKKQLQARQIFAVAFGSIYIECKNIQMDHGCCLSTISTDEQRTFFQGPIVEDDSKLASRLIRYCLNNDNGKMICKHVNSDPFGSRSQTMAYERECKYLNKFNFDNESRVLNGVLNDIVVKTNKFIYFNVSGNIMLRDSTYKNVYQMETLTDALIIKCNQLHARLQSCYTFTGFRVFRVKCYKHR